MLWVPTRFGLRFLQRYFKGILSFFNASFKDFFLKSRVSVDEKAEEQEEVAPWLPVQIVQTLAQGAQQTNNEFASQA